MLPQKIYEILRWVISVVIPAIGTAISSLNAVCGWDLPMETILGIFSVVETFLGAVFLRSKIVNDNNNAE